MCPAHRAPDNRLARTRRQRTGRQTARKKQESWRKRFCLCSAAGWKADLRRDSLVRSCSEESPSSCLECSGVPKAASTGNSLLMAVPPLSWCRREREAHAGPRWEGLQCHGRACVLEQGKRAGTSGRRGWRGGKGVRRLLVASPSPGHLARGEAQPGHWRFGCRALFGQAAGRLPVLTPPLPCTPGGRPQPWQEGRDGGGGRGGGIHGGWRALGRSRCSRLGCARPGPGGGRWRWARLGARASEAAERRLRREEAGQHPAAAPQHLSGGAARPAAAGRRGAGARDGRSLLSSPAQPDDPAAQKRAEEQGAHDCRRAHEAVLAHGGTGRGTRAPLASRTWRNSSGP